MTHQYQILPHRNMMVRECLKVSTEPFLLYSPVRQHPAFTRIYWRLS